MKTRTDRPSAQEEELRARLNLVHSRGLRLGSLKRLVAASIPVWIQAHTQALPGLLAWLAAVLFGFSLAETVLHSVLEHVWTRRARRLGDGGTAAAIHEYWTVRDEIGSGFLYGVGVVSLIPWAAVLLGRELLSALYPLSWLALGLAALGLLAAGLSRR